MSPFPTEINFFRDVNCRDLAPHPSAAAACPMRSTTGIQEENDCGINYLWRRWSQTPPRSRTGWMVIPQTAQVYVHRIHRLETLPSVCQNSAGGMLLRDPLPFTLSFWPFFFGHCLLSLLWLSCQVSYRARIRRAACQLTHEDLQAWHRSGDGAQISAAELNAFFPGCSCQMLQPLHLIFHACLHEGSGVTHVFGTDRRP